MKLAFCLYNYFPFGGLQRDFLRIAKECVKRGHQVDVYTMVWDDDLDPELSVTMLPQKACQNHTRSQQFVKALQPYLREHHYDLVVGFNKMPGLDVYYAADTCVQEKTRQKHGAWYRWLPRYHHLLAYEQAVFERSSTTEILMISATEQAVFEKFYHTQPARFHLLPPGIARDRIAPFNAEQIRQELRAEFKLADDTFLLLAVGSGFKAKGLDRSLLAIAALPTALKQRTKLIIIGKDNQTIFQQQANRLGITDQVTFLQGRNDVPRFLLGADLLLHPAYHENTGTVLLEALTAGLPVLTTDVCGYAHYIDQAQAGKVLKSPYQQTDFNQTLVDMLLLPERKIWQQNGISFAKQADIYSMPERAVDKIESFKKC
ncbi:MAG: glycosyltransferase family 4 protein [Gammaproteobacteria bacterium]